MCASRLVQKNVTTNTIAIA